MFVPKSTMRKSINREITMDHRDKSLIICEQAYYQGQMVVFLDAATHLYEMVCPSSRQSVCQ